MGEVVFSGEVSTFFSIGIDSACAETGAGGVIMGGCSGALGITGGTG